ncbi:MAG: DUF4197 domain-containing protein [Chitinophagales bacterium]|nr:DUF4197 domain-containing protein [Bacteroidota bacterium]MCB9255607.1 DUF4197 domain-containing protein [Chitinophagales bacterium]
MRKFGLFTILFLVCFGISLQSCEELNDFLDTNKTAEGLKEALKISTDTTVTQAGVLDGFYQNATIKILFPEEADQILSYVNANPILGAALGTLTENFVQRMNRAAEQAAPLAKDIFYETITNITISDALGILNGGDYAATNFLENNARPALYNAFKPIVENKISEVGADAIWSQVTGGYNTLTGQQVNTDINDYVTNKALDGLFHLIGEEEKKIREDPLHRVTELLQEVFG